MLPKLVESVGLKRAKRARDLAKEFRRFFASSAAAAASEKLQKLLESVKQRLYDSAEGDREEIALAFIHHHLLVEAIRDFGGLNYESRNLLSRRFISLLSFQFESQLVCVEYVLANKEILLLLLKGFDTTENANLVGGMLKACCHHAPLCREIFQLPIFYKIFDYIRDSRFEIASESFGVLESLLTRNKPVAIEFLLAEFDRFFERYLECLSPAQKNYMVRRQSICLLGKVFLDRTFLTIITKFVNLEKNLKVLMGLLLDSNASIRFEAFHVFKLFVGNPDKSDEVFRLLRRNKDKLIAFFADSQKDGFLTAKQLAKIVGPEHVAPFLAERADVVAKIKDLERSHAECLARTGQGGSDDDAEEEGEAAGRPPPAEADPPSPQPGRAPPVEPDSDDPEDASSGSEPEDDGEDSRGDESASDAEDSAEDSDSSEGRVGEDPS